MAKFLTGHELNHALEKIIADAEEKLILISPYVKLHPSYASILKTKKENHKLEIIVVFGKNEDNLAKSMKIEDLSFFKEFPNIEIRYEKRLHAKYYANEADAILTSMNLWSYSQDNNIEAGIRMSNKNLLVGLANTLGGEDPDPAAYKYFTERVIEQSQKLYKKIPQYENTLLGFSKKYIKSEVVEDTLSTLFKIDESYNKNQFNNKKDIQPLSNTIKKENGYCIWTGVQIPFNVKNPLSSEGYKIWTKYGKDVNYPQKYCHFSGDASKGETSYKKPILNKYWKKAQEVHGSF